jgi:hypothetical protein
MKPKGNLRMTHVFAALEAWLARWSGPGSLRPAPVRATPARSAIWTDVCERLVMQRSGKTRGMWIVLATLAVGGSLTLRAQPDGPATNAAATNAIAAPAARGETNGDAMRVPERTAPAPHASDSASTTSRTDFAAFRVIAEHNIFNGNRSGQRITSTRSGSLQRSVRVDAFTLVGTLDSGKGWLAFFDGTQSDYHKVLRAGDSIAGFKVKEIIYSGVRFDENGAELALRVGSSLRREDGGAWFVSATSGSYASSRAGESHSSYNGSGGSSTTVSSSNSDGGAAPSGAMSDVLKRLMERREKE